jgi:hypothetical protein
LEAPGADVELTPETSATLAAGPAATGDNAGEPYYVALAKSLLVGGSSGTLEISKGSLKVLPGTTLGISAGTTLSVPKNDESPSLVLDDGAYISLGAVNSVLSIGDASITTSGDATATNAPALLASGVVTFRDKEISGVGSTLTSVNIVEGSLGAVITVDDPTTAAGGKILTLKGVTLDLSGEAGGSLVIKGYASTPNKVVLAAGTNPGKIVLGEDNTPISWSNVAKIPDRTTPANIATVTGSGVATGSDDTATATLGSIAGGTMTGVTITGASTANSDVTLVNGSALAQ